MWKAKGGKESLNHLTLRLQQTGWCHVWALSIRLSRSFLTLEKQLLPDLREIAASGEAP